MNHVHDHAFHFLTDLQQVLQYLNAANPWLGSLMGYLRKAKGFPGPRTDKM